MPCALCTFYPFIVAYFIIWNGHPVIVIGAGRRGSNIPFFHFYSAQYSNLVGTIGRTGKHGPFTLYIEDAKTFFLDEDLPAKYERRELPFYTPEGAAYLDRMSQHIGFTIERPFPPNDGDGRDVEPEVANYERGHWCLVWCPSSRLPESHFSWWEPWVAD